MTLPNNENDCMDEMDDEDNLNDEYADDCCEDCDYSDFYNEGDCE